jgi:hypothetical protein
MRKTSAAPFVSVQLSATALTHVTPVTSELLSVSNNDVIGRLLSSDTTLHTLRCITDQPVSS